MVQRRLHGEPVAYITGAKEFYGRRFAVGPGCLVPRPETELLVDRARELARGCDGAALRVLDIGTGSGCIAVTLALELPGAAVTAVDVAEDALAWARRNAEALGAPVTFVHGDGVALLDDDAWLSAAGPFDLVVSNPPYIVAGDPHLDVGDLRFEPACALSPGGDGLDALRAIVAGAPARLAAGGWLMVEHGYDQADAVRALFAEAGFEAIESRRDLAGIPRIALGRLGSEP